MEKIFQRIKPCTEEVEIENIQEKIGGKYTGCKNWGNCRANKKKVKNVEAADHNKVTAEMPKTLEHETIKMLKTILHQVSHERKFAKD